jgi:hypothetical protein
MNSTGLAIGLPQVQQFVLHQLPRLHVERGERLVHQEDLRIQDQHLRERDALPHAAGELVGIAIAETGETDAGEPVVRLRNRRAAIDAVELEPGGDVGERVAPRDQRIGLEHVPGARVDAGERRAENADFAG